MASLDSLMFHLSETSTNKKTGKIAVSTSSKVTCPISCKFRPENGGGCYAASGPLNLHWIAVTNNKRGVSFSEFCKQLKNIEDGRMFRHNQAGDLFADGEIINRDFMAKLTASVKHLRGFTYTHHPLNEQNVETLKQANQQGFTVNVSTESEAAADAAIANGLPAVMVVNSDESRRHWHTEGGNVVQVCPAQLRDEVTCKSCKLCQKRGCKVVIAFKAHGTGKKKANANLTA